jgi:hypothetical protein
MNIRFFNFIAAGFALASSVAFANTNVKCGQSLNGDVITGFELEIASDDDKYDGPVGEHWDLKLDSEDAEWLSPNQNITAKKYRQGADTIIEITILSGPSAVGPVGTIYKLISLYDEEPVLEKYIMGFAGQKIGTFRCISAVD